jgi:polyhydroxyalkanoate synthase
MPFDQAALPADHHESVALTAFEVADRFVQGQMARLTGGRSPVAAMEAWVNWFCRGFHR